MVTGLARSDSVAHPDAGEAEQFRQRARDDDALTARQRLLVGKAEKGFVDQQCRPSRETVVGEGPERRRVGRFAGRIVRVADDGERMTVRVGGQQVVVWDELRRPALEPDLAGVLAEAGIGNEDAVVGPNCRLDRQTYGFEAAGRGYHLFRFAVDKGRRGRPELGVVVRRIRAGGLERFPVRLRGVRRDAGVRVRAEIQQVRVVAAAVWDAPVRPDGVLGPVAATRPQALDRIRVH